MRQLKYHDQLGEEASDCQLGTVDRRALWTMLLVLAIGLGLVAILVVGATFVWPHPNL